MFRLYNPGKIPPQKQGDLDYSDEVPEGRCFAYLYFYNCLGGISERVFLGMIRDNNVDYGSSFSTDKSLFKRAHTVSKVFLFIYFVILVNL